jgi:hypothetical protein
MRLLARNAPIRTRIGVEAARTMRERFSAAAVGRIAEDRLKSAYGGLHGIAS